MSVLLNVTDLFRKLTYLMYLIVGMKRFLFDMFVGIKRFYSKPVGNF